MSRLITFGCSFTYGHGLIDCFKDCTKPSNLGWAPKLATLLNRSLVNISSPGASNLEILYNILNFNFEKEDIVVIMWSLPLRDLVFKKRLFDPRPFTPYKVLLNKPWYKRQWLPDGTLKDYIVKSWIYMQHADLLLQHKELSFIHYPAFPDQLSHGKPDFINLTNLHMDGFVIVDKAEDNSHPGLISNTLTAEKIYRIVNV